MEEYGIAKNNMYVQSTQEIDSSDNEEMYVGMMYKSKQDLQQQKSYSIIKEQFHYKMKTQTRAQYDELQGQTL